METFDLAVVGAGPAGLAAARTAAEAGLVTVLLDQNPSAGGQVWRGALVGGPRALTLAHGDGRARAAVAAAERAGAVFRFGATVWDVADDGTLAYVDASGSHRLRAAAVVLAPGAMERPVPFAGWTLPGVMGAGAVQTALKTGGLVPDGPWVLAGSGPLMLLVLAQLQGLGAPPTAVLDTTAPGALGASLRHLPAAALGAPGLLARGLGLLWRRWRSGVRVVRGVRRLEALGRERLEAVVAHTETGAVRLAAGLLAVHEGVVPQTAAARLLHVPHRWNEVRRCFEPEVDAFGRVAGRNLWIAGDGAGIEGEQSAAVQGRLAALDVASALGRMHDRDDRARPLLRQRRRQQAARRLLDALYPAPKPAIPDDVVVCRCERVTAGAIRAAVAAGADGPNRAKTFTRCGMGLCQGRMCGLALTEIVAGATGRPPDAVGALRIRPPLLPIRLDDLAALET